MDLLKLVLLFSLILSINGQFQCNNSYECQETNALMDVSTQPESVECLRKCQATENCQWYTFYPALTENNCKLFQDCQFSSYCRPCITGQVTCPSLDCDLQGLCQGQFLEVYESLTKDKCGQECINHQTCTWYSYNTENQECLLFETCPSLDQNQADQVSNPVDCARIPMKNKLVISTGSPADKSVKTEVIDLSTPFKLCNDLPDFPIKVYGASGSLVNEHEMVVCGGNTVNVIDARVRQCYRVGSDINEPIGELELPRYEGTSLPIPNGIWIMGGSTTSLSRATEMVFLNGSNLPGPDLPLHAWLHCATYIDSSRAMIIGGQQEDDNNPNAVRTFIYDFVFGNWTGGPDLKLGRSDHACGTFYSSFHGSNVVASIGGVTDEQGMTTSVELLQIGVPDAEWIQGPDLPFELCCMSAVANPAGDGLLIVGGYSGDAYQAMIHELTCPTSSGCAWTTLNQLMKVPRYRHVSFLTYENANITCP